ncbi:hypothetical protein RB49ORF074c [Escherichia phage RB49]|uniref:Uncharacterized protein n=8 Tax=Krischvirus TaxID=1913651 RepID=Q76ZG7_BPRB4|nr:hypothetical protein RB49p074 [Escherichia phage RB49]YP_001469417.1 hypothetical protein phi1p074 [Escherichia phage Phi1]YP_009118758.1 hypothetical protein BN201_0075 [Enterobacteria phage GEC-3S]YP_010097360.1 hypothetical protein KNU01_gp226 [Escherichia virus KFS-EC]AUV64034.1 hypothetical protein Sf20_gp215 [Shigella phage Sf20]EHU9813604.1 hypothetical protein [Escherichia coli]QHB48672.1 hypothetical protein [Escherichia phage E26]QHR66136.1 hypothetical protein kaaroe_100 [Esche
MKIEIIDDGGFSFMNGVKLPIIVEGRRYGLDYLVETQELQKAGVPIKGYFPEYEWCFRANEAWAV